MPDYLGDEQRAVKKEDAKKEEKPIESLTEADIALFKKYGTGYYYDTIKAAEDDIARITKSVNDLTGIKESDTGLANPALWDLAADKLTLQQEQPLQVRFSGLQNARLNFSNFLD
jgi:26S proteasome regulatory subunit T1